MDNLPCGHLIGRTSCQITWTRPFWGEDVIPSRLLLITYSFLPCFTVSVLCAGRFFIFIFITTYVLLKSALLPPPSIFAWIVSIPIPTVVVCLDHTPKLALSAISIIGREELLHWSSFSFAGSSTYTQQLRTHSLACSFNSFSFFLACWLFERVMEDGAWHTPESAKEACFLVLTTSVRSFLTRQQRSKARQPAEPLSDSILDDKKGLAGRNNTTQKVTAVEQNTHCMVSGNTLLNLRRTH